MTLIEVLVKVSKKQLQLGFLYPLDSVRNLCKNKVSFYICIDFSFGGLHMYIPRTIEKTVRNISATYPVLLITGPRQVGKTTLLRHLAEEDRKYVSLDDPKNRNLAISDPALFFQRFSPPIIIDEIQYAPELLPYIKMYADENKRNGDFWLTGSQMFHMMRNISESLAGRAGVMNLFGLSNNELQNNHFGCFTTDSNELLKRLSVAKKMDLMEIFNILFRGSFPRLYEDPEVLRDTYYDSYIRTYLERDIRDLTQVADEGAFYKFLCIVAARTATTVNYKAMASECGITAPTAKQWLSLLVTSGLVILIEPYFNNLLKRVIKSPRMYFVDTGLCTYLTKWNSVEALEAGAMSGKFFETWVVSEIYKSFINNGKRPPLYYYRDSNKKEIDLIIDENNTLYPIEIKKSSSPSKATKNFNALDPVAIESVGEEEKHLKSNIGTGAVVCLCSDLLPINKNNWYVPAWLI